MRRRARTNWYALRDEAESALASAEGFSSSVQIDGKLNHLGSGLSHDNYIFHIRSVGATPFPKECAYVLRRVRDESVEADGQRAPARLRNEARTLQALASHDLDFTAPRFVCFVGDHDDGPSGFIETAVPGIPCDWLKRDPGQRSVLIETTARIAAGVHGIPTGGFPFLLGCTDGREHVLAELTSIADDFLKSDADAALVEQWLRGHLPEGRPAVLLHGDLLAQNLLRDLPHGRPGVVDWEYARVGDPAYDLAIVTRGNRNLFGAAGGRRELVEAYRKAGGVAITVVDVLNHELLLVLHWLKEAVQREQNEQDEGPGGNPSPPYRSRLQALLRRAESAECHS